MSRIYMTVEQIIQRKARQAKRPLFTLSATVTVLPTYGSVKQYCPVAYDQGNIGSCTANAFCMAYRILSIIKKTADSTFLPSRLYVYYKERLIEDPGRNPADITDSGADVTDGEYWAQTTGICSENTWPYITSNVDVAPPAIADTEAIPHKIKSYTMIPVDSNAINNIRASLANNVPVLIGIAVYSSFEGTFANEHAVIPLPQTSDSFLGGHEILLVGYTDAVQLFTFINSWGQSWGKNGFAYLPYAYVSNPNLTWGLSVISLD